MLLHDDYHTYTTTTHNCESCVEALGGSHDYSTSSKIYSCMTNVNSKGSRNSGFKQCNAINSFIEDFVEGEGVVSLVCRVLLGHQGENDSISII